MLAYLPASVLSPSGRLGAQMYRELLLLEADIGARIRPRRPMETWRGRRESGAGSEKQMTKTIGNLAVARPARVCISSEWIFHQIFGQNKAVTVTVTVLSTGQ